MINNIFKNSVQKALKIQNALKNICGPSLWKSGILRKNHPFFRKRIKRPPPQKDKYQQKLKICDKFLMTHKIIS